MADSSFDALAYQLIGGLIERHDDEVVGLKVELDHLREQLAGEKAGQEALVQSLKELRAITREFMKDVVNLAYTESPELLRGKIYALVAAYPQIYKKKTKKSDKKDN